MSMQAATIEILTTKAGFQPQVACAIAEAIDTEINGSQFLTTAAFENRMTQQDMKWEARFAQTDAKFEARFGQVDSRFAQVDTRMAQMETRIVLKLTAIMLALFGIMTGALITAARMFLVPG